MIPKGEGTPTGSFRRGLEERLILFTALMWLGAVIVLEALSHVGGTFLENWSANIEMKPKSQIYSEQQALVLSQLRTDTNDIFDPDLGWTYRPNYRGRLYSNNSAGLRGIREYASLPPIGVTRIAAFGDSFVYGSEVADQDTWAYQLEQILSNVEVLNFGIGGYGTDQAYLRYRKFGKQYRPHIVLIGFMPVDLRRNVNVYRRFITSNELVHLKPRFVLGANSDLVLVPLPIRTAEDYLKLHQNPEVIREFGALDYFYKPLVYENPLYDYSATIRLASQAMELIERRVSDRKRLYNGRQFNPEAEAFEITVKIIRKFVNEIDSNGSVPVVVMLPSYDDIREQESRRVKSYEPLATSLRVAGIEVVDLAEGFKGPVNQEDHFMPSGHYSPRSNRIIAEYLACYLQKRQLGVDAILC